MQKDAAPATVRRHPRCFALGPADIAFGVVEGHTRIGEKTRGHASVCWREWQEKIDRGGLLDAAR